MIQIHWRKLPKITSTSGGYIDIDFDDIEHVIQRYHERYQLDLYPDFQRGRVWREDQKIKFVEFLLKGGETNNTIYFNHPGWKRSYKGQMVLVDGLQRLTSVFEFLNNKILVFNKYYRSDINLSGCYCFKFNINDLRTKIEVLNWYLEMNENSTPHTKDELDIVKSIIEREKYE